MTFLVAVGGRREERGPSGLRLVIFARRTLILGRSRDLSVRAGGICVLTVDDPLAAGGAPDRAHAGARRVVKSAAVVDRQPLRAGDGLVDDPLHVGGVEVIETPVVQRRGDRLKQALHFDLTLHC